jgi:nucleotide-binding universal stress UspA family protein
MRVARDSLRMSPMAFRHILVPTDFSQASEKAEEAAVALARAFGARLSLLHVWSLPNMDYTDVLSWPVDAMEAAAREGLAAAHARASQLYANTEAILRAGRPWKCILDEVRERNVDLIVMATHGRQGFPRVLLGSVAEKIVRLSPVPVLTLRDEGVPAR